MITLDVIKQRYKFQVQEVLYGNNVVKSGKCTQWQRRKENKSDKEIIYIQLQVLYRGIETKKIAYSQFHLEDSESYFNAAMAPEGYLDISLGTNQAGSGGLLFALYQDVQPIRLWFDTGICYENSKDEIMIDIPLSQNDLNTRTQILSREQLASSYGEQLASGSNVPPEFCENWIEEISNLCASPYKKISNGYILRMLLPEGRKQNLILTFTNGEGPNTKLVKIGAICGPTSAQTDDRQWLLLNTILIYGAIGVSQFQNQDYYVLTETLPLSNNMDMATVAEILNYLAQQSDWIEKKLRPNAEKSNEETK